MHIFPQLRKLEEKYQEELVVLGVHSAKFTSEKDTANIEKAIRRLELEHPVVNDKDFRVWSQYSARAWPTLYVVDPEGNILGRHEGEITFDAFDRVIRDMITEFEGRGTLDRTPIPGLSAHKEEGGTLSFPSKIIADEKGSRLFVSDSNHNRVLSISMDGKILDVIGGGDVGLEDGDYADAKFHHPHGLTLSGDSLYVADTENHAIRRIDLRERRVETIAGTGEQARTFHDGGVGSVDLNSPWDLTCLDGMLYIAMAGFHQLWVMHLESGLCGAICRKRQGGHQGRVSPQRDACPADGDRHGRRYDLLRGQRDERSAHGNSRRIGEGEHAGGNGPVRLRGQGWSRGQGTASARAGCVLARGDAVRDGHLQQQDQANRASHPGRREFHWAGGHGVRGRTRQSGPLL